MKIQKITEEELKKVNLPAKTKIKIFFKAIPMIITVYVVMAWEVFLEVLKTPSIVIDDLSLKESIIHVLENKDADV